MRTRDSHAGSRCLLPTIRAMSDEKPLEVAAAFTPFDGRETRQMRRYRDKAKELSECELLGKSLTLNVKPGERHDESGVTHAVMTVVGARVRSREGTVIPHNRRIVEREDGIHIAVVPGLHSSTDDLDVLA
jgi:hypothetical protein